MEQDYAKAAEFYRRAAELGNADAQNNLGLLYLYGDGVEQDYAEAAGLFFMAAEQGNPYGYNNLGYIYLNGCGVEQDYTKAAEFFYLAAEKDYFLAYYNLGCLYENGLGVEQNYETAADFYRTAAEQGYQPAQEGYDYCIAAAEEQKQTAAADADAANEGAAFHLGVYGDYRYIGYSDGTAVLQQYLGSDESVTVPAYFGSCRVTAIAPFAFYDENGRVNQMTSITVEPGIEKISPYAFMNCFGLREVHLPDTVSSIGLYAFSSCWNMEKLYLPDRMEYYPGLSNLFGVEVPENLEVYGEANVTETQSGSSDGTDGTPADSDGFVIDGNVLLKYVGDAAQLTIPGEVTVIGPEAFINNKALLSVYIPEGVTEIGDYAFAGCNNIEEINLPDGLRVIGKYAFEKCNALVSFTIPDSVYLVGNYALKGCKNLQTVDLGRGMTGILNYTPLADCNALKEVIARDNLICLSQYAVPVNNQTKPVIYGIEGSVAHRYATQNGLTFVPLAEKASRASVKVERTTYSRDQCVPVGGFSFWLPAYAVRMEGDSTIWCWEMDENTPKAYMKFWSVHLGLSGREFNSSYNSGEDAMRRILQNMGVSDSVLIISHPVEAPWCVTQVYSRNQTINGKTLQTTEQLNSYYDVITGDLTYVYYSYSEDAEYLYGKEFEAVIASKEYFNQGTYSKEVRELLDKFVDTYQKAWDALNGDMNDPETLREAYQVYYDLGNLTAQVRQIGDYMLDAETYSYYHQVKDAVDTDVALTLTQLSIKLGIELGDYISR